MSEQRHPDERLYEAAYEPSHAGEIAGETRREDGREREYPRHPWTPVCAAVADRLTPGADVAVRGRKWRVAGRVVATDHEETWLEVLLEDGSETSWLAVETLGGDPRLSLWRRSEATTAGFDLASATLRGAVLTETARGAARYVTEGRFGLDLPAAGRLVHREYEGPEGRVAAARFSPEGPWLVGVGTPLGGAEALEDGSGEDEGAGEAGGTAEPGDWWTAFFGDIYTDSDIEQQDPGLTRAMVDCVTALVPPATHHRLLDLACGTGRHAVPLAGAGYRVTGADLSADYLGQARRRAAAAGRDVAFVRADMRDLGAFPDGSFDAVTNLHTSFGFFHDGAEDMRVLHEVRRVLAPGGRFLLDVVNRDAFLRQTSEVFGVPEDQYVIRNFDSSTGRTFLHEEVFDPLTSRIRWTVTEPATGRSSTADYRVFSAHELVGMLRAAGLRVEAVHGDYDRSPFTVHAPSVVVLASAPPAL
ncbi:DUF4178 domain-containing protein [Streptomyces albireticuli]|uniref:Methyltransferase domain-containing protein n=1 Tax=Streptomyces albireticuli TaxID=1940 RepID=A0A2A2D9Z6_9ACTN|nr:DUF4178 domain-containing protein [Streptomyces albireticuli]MCD9144043.1 DUF4178 domain-containing protein [Streptomyces albireticuli]MCD9162314.1 DUF4178 domain-containing protein [Streptomyces albireticuli]MCD9195517.1 DUF4178 domain-containing protein [Streptomyces albireticuli]PAU48199.1 hypothetical protein CK936_14655 [Streptomyces albireticuli]